MNIRVKYIFFFSIALVWIFTSISCKKDFTYVDGAAKLRYETDTLSFDTVFTAVGSATRYFKIYNDDAQPALIDVRLANLKGQFRINVDGIKGNSVKGIEVGPKDSVYVFVEVTVNPNSPLSVSPFIIEENLLINNGGREEKVLLVANGQNANYIPRENSKGSFSYLSCNFGTVNWNDPKPYVIYGILIIDSCSLNLPAGAKVYVHGGLVQSENGYYNDGQIIILSGGNIKMNGTLEKKVIIQGDRLEQEYKDVAGQWGGIRIFKGSEGNNINYAEIKNSIIGVSVDSAGELTIKNTVIKNCAGDALLSNRGRIFGDNLLIYNTGKRALAIGYGGRYEFNHCTFHTTINNDPSIFMSNWRCQDPPECDSKVFFQAFLDFTMRNSIISGGSDDEISIAPFDKSDLGTIKFDLKLTNNVVRVKDLIKTTNYPTFFNYCKDCYNLKPGDKLYLNSSKEDFRLDTMSVGLSKANYLSNVPKDILGKDRDRDKTDLGCYEF